MKCLNIYIVVIGKTWGEFFRLKMEMETRQDKNDEKQKENEKDIINNINDAIFVVWLKND